MQKRALILSPFSSVPQDAGQRRRTYQTTRALKDMGYRITFFLYAFEEGWKASANEAWIEEMAGDWHEVIVWHANPKVGTPPRHGDLHQLDEWWDETLETGLKQLFSYRFFDAFVVHNVWLSKALELAPRGTMRILDAHDVFSSRLAHFRQNPDDAEFFRIDEESEGSGASRADIVLAIQQDDKIWFEAKANTRSIFLPYVPPGGPVVPRADYANGGRVVLGFLGSAHIFNLRGLKSFCSCLRNAVGKSGAPIEFKIGGGSTAAITEQGPWRLVKDVPDERVFFSDVDIVVVPVFNGSGFKVKMADAVFQGLPVLASEHAALGLELDPSHQARTAEGLAEMSARVAIERPPYSQLAAPSVAARDALSRSWRRGMSELSAALAASPRAIAYDIRGLDRKEALLVLLSWCGAFHVNRLAAKQYIVGSQDMQPILQGRLVPSVEFVAGESDSKIGVDVRRWISAAAPKAGNVEKADERVVTDPFWTSVFDPTSGAVNVLPDDGSVFSPSVRWDQLARKLLGELADPVTSESAKKPRHLYVVDERHCERLRQRLPAVVPNAEVLAVASRESFFRAVALIAAGLVDRAAIAASAHMQRNLVLAELCYALSIDCVFVGRDGRIRRTPADAPGRSELLRSFDKKWRSFASPDTNRTRQ